MSDIVERLVKIADASRRADGSDIPLGAEVREAAAEIERLRARCDELKSIINWIEAVDAALVDDARTFVDDARAALAKADGRETAIQPSRPSQPSKTPSD